VCRVKNLTYFLLSFLCTILILSISSLSYSGTQYSWQTSPCKATGKEFVSSYRVQQLSPLDHWTIFEIDPVTGLNDGQNIRQDAFGWDNWRTSAAFWGGTSWVLQDSDIPRMKIGVVPMGYVSRSIPTGWQLTLPVCTNCIAPYVWDDEQQQCLVPCDTTLNDLLPDGSCLPKCPSPQFRGPSNLCYDPCPEGQVKIFDPERCQCIDGTKILINGECVDPPTCDDILAEAIALCHGQDWIETFECQDNGGGTIISAYTCKNPPVCPGQSVWSWETKKCEPIPCTSPQVWNPVLSKCEDPHICNPPKVWDFETEKCDYPDPGLCAPDEIRDAYGNCFSPMPVPDPENPDPNQPDPGTCPEGTTMDDEGDCRQDQPPNPDDPPDTDPDPNAEPIIKEDPDEEKDDGCPPGEVMTNDGCKPRNTGDKIGKQGFFGGKELSGKGVVTEQTWGFGEGTSQSINYGPIIDSVNAWEQTSIVRALDSMTIIANSLTSVGSAPRFEFEIFGHPLVVDLEIFNPLANVVRLLLTVFLYFALTMVIIRQWRML